MARLRVRQHVNPLSSRYQQQVTIPDWSQVYDRPYQPLHLDIGCAWGKFILQMAQIEPNYNFLGVEIRQPLVREANKVRDELNLRNLYYFFANVNNSLEQLLASLPVGVLQWVTIQFPDPWFKTKHQKRRVVQPDLVATLAQYLSPEGIVFLQSDVESVAAAMVQQFQIHPAFERQHREPWLANNLFPVATEREIATLNKEQPVYRALFQKIAIN